MCHCWRDNHSNFDLIGVAEYISIYSSLPARIIFSIFSKEEKSDHSLLKKNTEPGDGCEAAIASREELGVPMF